MNLIKKSGQGYWEDMVITPWCNTLTEEEEQELISSAISVIEFLAKLPFESITNQNVLHQKGKCLMSAIFFLSKNDATILLNAIKRILEIKEEGRYLLRLDVNNSQLDVAICDVKYFNMIAVSSVNNISSLVKRNDHDLKTLLISIFCETFRFADIRCSYSIVVTKTMNLLLKNHLSSFDLEGMHFPIISLMGSFMIICPFNKAIEHLHKMSEIFMDSWSEDKKCRIFNALCMNYTWDSFDSYIIIYLMGPTTNEKSVLTLCEIMKCVCMMLHDRNVSKAAIKVLKSLVKYVDGKVWVDQFLPILMKVIPEDDIDKSCFTRSLLLECFDISVKQYGVALYEDVKKSVEGPGYIKETDLIATILTLTSCFKRNLLNFLESEPDIRRLYCLTHDHAFLQDYILKSVCFCHDKNVVVLDSQLNFVINYLQDLVYLPDRDYSFNEMWYFMSHICVSANFSINIPDVFDSYTTFVDNIYNFCMNNLKSRCPDRIAIAHEIYHITETVFSRSWRCLKTKYQLPEKEHFKDREGNFYSLLMENKKWPFAGQSTFQCLYHEFHATSKVYLEIPRLIIEWSNCYPCEENSKISKCFDHGICLFEQKFDFESIIKGSYYILISICYKRNRSENFYGELSLVMEKWNEEIVDFLSNRKLTETFPLYGLTTCVNKILRSGFINDIVKVGYSKKELFHHSHSILTVLASLDDPDDSFPKHLCMKKAIEHTLTTCLDIIECVLGSLEDSLHGSEDLIKCALDVVNMITKKSNKKRPVAAAATSIRKLCANILSKDCQNGAVIKLLDNVLNSIYDIPVTTLSKMRRNPEHRLVIHAIVSANENSSQIFVPNVMNFLLDLLKDSSLTNSRIISALNATEILLSDSALRIQMLPFIEPVAIYCINQLSNTDWAVRNATIQVFQSFVNRVLGQKTNSWFRRNSLEDIFILLPKLANFFKEKLYNASIEDESNSIVGILAFFSESHRKSTVFLNRDRQLIVDDFLEQFLNFMILDKGFIGLFASNAFVAVCSHVYIPVILRELVDWLKSNFNKKNIFGTCMYLIRDLYQRFKDFGHVPYYEDGMKVINAALFDLNEFLQSLNETYEFSLFCLLNVKVNRMDNIIKAIPERSQINSFESRLWLNNNIPFLLTNIKIEEFCDVLKLCLSVDQLIIHDNCLGAVLERFDELRKKNLVTKVLQIIIDTFLCLNDPCKYLSDGFCNVILFLLEIDSYGVDDDLLDKFSCKFQNISDLEIASVYIALLAKRINFSAHHKIFINETVTLYKQSVQNPELQFHIAWTLKYLYECVDESTDRHKILHLAFVLLLNSETSNEIYKFLASIFNIECFSLPLMVDHFLSSNNLIGQFGNIYDTCKFLVDITASVLVLDDGFSHCEQFYMKQNDNLSFNKIFLKKLLLKTINETLGLEIIDKNCEDILLIAMISLVM